MNMVHDGCGWEVCSGCDVCLWDQRWMHLRLKYRNSGVSLSNRTCCICGRCQAALSFCTAGCTSSKCLGLQTMDAAFRSDYPAVTRWFTTLAHQPNFSAVVGEVKLCEVPRKFTREPSPNLNSPLHPLLLQRLEASKRMLHYFLSTFSCIYIESLCQVCLSLPW